MKPRQRSALLSKSPIPSNELLELFENAPCGYLVVNKTREIVHANTTIVNWTGFSAADLIGKPFQSILNIASRIFFETHFAPLLSLQGVFDEVALTILNADGTPLPVLVNARRRQDSGGNPTGALITVFNSTDRRRYEQQLLSAKKAAEYANVALEELNKQLERRIAEGEELGARLRENEARLRMALEAGEIGSFEISIASNEISTNERFCQIFGLPFQFVFSVDEIESLIHPSDKGRASTKQQRTTGQINADIEFRIKKADTGHIRWVSRQAVITRAMDGTPTSMMGTVHDITERKTLDEQQRMLNEELSHRMKNTMSLVQAIASQTLRDAADRPAVHAFNQRVTALSHAHEILLRQSWAAADMREIVSGVLALHGDASRISLIGPILNLGPKAALSLSLLLHELATNAVKHGALSNEQGSIEVRWSISGADLVLTWEEKNGPSVVEPTRVGLGSRLIDMGLGGTGRVEKGYKSAGFTATFHASLKLIEEN